MLTLTPDAVAVLDETRSKSGLPDTVAVRISQKASDNGQAAAYELRFAAEPLPDDLILDAEGTRVFVAAGAAEPLVAAVLDAEETPEGRKLVLKRDRR